MATTREPRGRNGRLKVTDALFDAILEDVTQGATLAVAARKHGTAAGTIREHARSKPAWRTRLDRALDASAERRDPTRVFTEDKRRQFLAALETMRPAIAARHIGVSYSTIKQYRESHPDFRTAMVAVLDLTDANVEDALYKAATIDRNVTACQVWLYNRKPDQWRDQRRVGVTGGQDDQGHDKPVEIEHRAPGITGPQILAELQRDPRFGDLAQLAAEHVDDE